MEKNNNIFGNVINSILNAPDAKGGGTRAKKVRVGFAGDGPMLQAMARAYEGQALAGPFAMYCPGRDDDETAAGDAGSHSDLDEFIAAVDAVEVFGAPDVRRDELVLRLINEGKHISLDKPFATSVEQAERLIAGASRAGVLLRVNEPALFYSPYVKLKQLIDDMEIGEVCAIRIHANLCGKGGWGPAPSLFGDNPLLHPAFDNFALAAWLLGPVESVNTYATDFNAKKGGQAVVGLKFKKDGCYGCLDLTFAPYTAIRSDCYPCEDVIEAAGTDGIIWARHFHGKMTEEPWVEVRRGKKHYTIGIGSGLELEWADCLRASAAHFLKSVHRGRQPSLSGEDALAGLKVALAAAQADELNAEVKV